METNAKGYPPVEFVIASNFKPIDGCIDLRNKRGAVDEMATAITKRMNCIKFGIDYDTPLRFQVSRYFLNKPPVMKTLLAKCEWWTVINHEIN